MHAPGETIKKERKFSIKATNQVHSSSLNLAALRALATEGIQRGHMSMHAQARSLVARVLPDASEEMRARVLSELIQTKDIKEARALEIHQALTAT